MWINPMLSIWLYTSIGSIILFIFLLWKFYGKDENDN